MQITTKSNKANREITVSAPAILTKETVKEMVEILGEDLCLAKIKAQLTIDFRSMQRTLLESVDDNNDPTNSDEKILSMDHSDWKPELRIRKSVEEKAADLLSTMTPDQIKAALATMQANEAATEASA